MQEHPVPQNVTNFQFKLIGDMTLRQFGYVGTGLAIALVAFFANTNVLVINIVRYILIVGCPLIGFALAFLPIEGRPLDRWLAAFLKAIFGNTMYVWKKEGVHYSVLQNMTAATTPALAGPRLVPTAPRRMVRSNPIIRNRLDQEEASLLSHVVSPLAHTPGVPKPTAQALRPLPLAGPAKPSLGLAEPVRRTITGFAGAVTPSQSIPALQLSIAGPTVSAMRLPHQRPLTPRRIPTPSYVPLAQPVVPSPRPEHFSDIKVYPNRSQTVTDMQPTMVTLRPLTGNANQTRALDQLKQQNVTLFQELARIKASMSQQAHIPHQTGQAVGFLQDEAESLGKRLSTFDETLSQINKAVAAIAVQETGYQKTVDELKSQINQIAQEKVEGDAAFAKLRQDNEAKVQSLHSTEDERTMLKQKLAELEAELGSMHALTRDLSQRKDQLTTNLSAYQAEKTTPQAPGATSTSAPLPAPQESAHQVVPAQTDTSLANITTIPNAVSGYVFDRDNRPIMDVVIVVKKKGGPPVRALKSNRVGQFAIVTPLLEGNYEVSFEKDGYHFAVLAIACQGQIIPPLKVIGEKSN